MCLRTSRIKGQQGHPSRFFSKIQASKQKVQEQPQPRWYLRSRAASARCTCRPAPLAWWRCGRSSATSPEPLEDKRKERRECLERNAKEGDNDNKEKNDIRPTIFILTSIVFCFFLRCKSQRLINVRSVSQDRGEIIFFFCQKNKTKTSSTFNPAHVLSLQQNNQGVMERDLAAPSRCKQIPRQFGHKADKDADGR